MAEVRILEMDDIILLTPVVSLPEHPCWGVHCHEHQSLSLANPQQQIPIESFDVGVVVLCNIRLDRGIIL